jgi:uncharacterized protein
MRGMPHRSVCWVPIWNAKRPEQGLEHLMLGDRSADAAILGFDEAGEPFRLSYRLSWDATWSLHEAHLIVTRAERDELHLRTDGHGRWSDAKGHPLPHLDDCIDIDIWPTPFTNTFPIRRSSLAIGERRVFTMAHVIAPALTVRPMLQAYTRLDDRRYLYESLSGSGFRADITVDEDGIVVDYAGLFRRVFPS